MRDWDAEQYLRFTNERTQPAVDLVGRVAGLGLQPGRILDVGCGPGNSTRVLARQFPGAQLLGVDNSPEMVRTAKEQNPDLSFRLLDAGGDLAPLGSDFDLVFSNACLQWIPDHPALLPRLLGLLGAGGVLAVQLPTNERMQRLLADVAARDRWRARMPQSRTFYTLSPAEYYDLLSATVGEVALWQTTYYHRMPSHGEIVAWYRSTGLRPYLEQLPDNEKSLFEEDVCREVERAYPPQKDSEVLFPFPRLFFVAVR